MTEKEIRDFCHANGDRIMVRAKVDGAWGAHPFAGLSAADQETQIQFWTRLRQMPKLFKVAR